MTWLREVTIAVFPTIRSFDNAKIVDRIRELGLGEIRHIDADGNPITGVGELETSSSSSR
jgi:hypothetical protein